MKYMESGSFQGHPLMRLTLGLTLFFLLAFWVTNFALYFSKMDLRPASVVSYYNGSEEEFRPARTFGSMVEVTHAHLAMMAVVLLLLTHLVIFAPLRKGAKQALIIGTFLAALLDEAGGWLVRFVGPDLATVKIAGFVSLQGLLAFLMGSLAWSLIWPAPRRANGSNSALLLLALAFVWPAVSIADDPANGRRVRAYYLMGTLVQLEAAGPDSILDRAMDRAYGELERVDRLMSLYRPESELSRLNREGAGTPFPLSRSTFEVLQAALALAKESGGAFDPTVGPLRELWQSRESPPSKAEIERALAQVGYRQLVLDASQPAVSFRSPGVRVDLNGIAKGYAVDRALAAFRETGAVEAWVSLGESSLGSYGARREIAIRDPERPERQAARFRLDSGTVSTSGGYERGFNYGARGYAHVLDPRSGWPLERAVSATVVAREGEGMLADALSTAGLVLEPEEALALWRRFQVEGILLYRDGKRWVFKSTPGFPEL
jgi:thiamine biosynthesis lipoprotein